MNIGEYPCTLLIARLGEFDSLPWISDAHFDKTFGINISGILTSMLLSFTFTSQLELLAVLEAKLVQYLTSIFEPPRNRSNRSW